MAAYIYPRYAHKDASIANNDDIISFLGVLLNNSKATVAPADTINACPEGKANSESAAT